MRLPARQQRPRQDRGPRGVVPEGGAAALRPRDPAALPARPAAPPRRRGPGGRSRWWRASSASRRRPSEAFLIGFLRRDYGATRLFDMSRGGGLDTVQLGDGAWSTITLFVPCIANVFMIAKERGHADGPGHGRLHLPLRLRRGRPGAAGDARPRMVGDAVSADAPWCARCAASPSSRAGRACAERGCPLAGAGCRTLDCPRCGYAVPDERASRLAMWVRRFFAPAPLSQRAPQTLAELLPGHGADRGRHRGRSRPRRPPDRARPRARSGHPPRAAGPELRDRGGRHDVGPGASRRPRHPDSFGGDVPRRKVMALKPFRHK